MKLLDKQGNATATVISQIALDETDTVYNFEVQGFSTYHIGELGVWVHNANCCGLLLDVTRTLSEIRNGPGRVFSSNTLTELKVGQSLFNGRNSTRVPRQVADRLSGRSFNNFDQFRNAFWKEMANDPAVAQNFSNSNLAKMKAGKAPITIPAQHNGKNIRYELDHHIEIRDGGAVYNLDNIVIRTPANHVNKTGNR